MSVRGRRGRAAFVRALALCGLTAALGAGAAQGAPLHPAPVPGGARPAVLQVQASSAELEEIRTSVREMRAEVSAMREAIREAREAAESAAESAERAAEAAEAAAAATKAAVDASR